MRSEPEAARVAWDPLLAVEFLTVLRLRRWRARDLRDVARAQAFYPLVGLALGGMLALLDWLLASSLPSGPRAAVLVAALAAATRGLHLDGLADTFDGLLGGHDRERRLDIMRDPRLGSFGATALAVVLLLQWSAVAALSGDARRPALVLAPALGRFGMVAVTAAFPYARPGGLGTGYREAARGLPLWLAGATAIVAALALLGPAGAGVLLAAVAAALLMGWWAWRAVGGVTGDTYGASCEMGQAAALLAAVVAITRGWAG
jgi:adenosylcobinamide-GDP ribazoletransferase